MIMESVRLSRLLYSFSKRCNRLTFLGQTTRDLHKEFNLDNLIKERMRKELIAESKKMNAPKIDAEKAIAAAFMTDSTSDIGKSNQETSKALQNYSRPQETPEKQTKETDKSIPSISAANISVSGLNVKKSSSTAPENKHLRDAPKLNSSKPLKNETTRTAEEKRDETARIAKLNKDSFQSPTTTNLAPRTTASEKSITVPIKEPNNGPAKPKTDAAKRATTSSVQEANTPKSPATSSTPKEQKPMNVQKDKANTRYKVIIQTCITNKPNLLLKGNAMIIRSDQFKKDQNAKNTNTTGTTSEKPAKK